MTHRITPVVEFIFGTVTVASTLFFTEFITDLVIGVVVYFTSRFLYRKYGDRFFRWIERISKKPW